MTRHDSDSELSDQVTPRRPRVVHLPTRGEQSSGFFDLDALYPVRIQPIHRPPPLHAPPRPPPLPPAANRRMPRVQIVETPRRVAALRRQPRRQPIGWFAVFVAWLAMTTTAVLVTTQLPGHARVRARIASPSLAPAPAPATATATATASGPPTVAFSDLPRSLPASRTPRVRHAAAPAPPAPRSAQDADAPSLPPVKTPVKAVVAALPPPSPAAPAPAPPPASNGTPSLEDLIRHEVDAEQKRLHDASRK